jgi:hypothetical protein
MTEHLKQEKSESIDEAYKYFVESCLKINPEFRAHLNSVTKNASHKANELSSSHHNGIYANSDYAKNKTKTSNTNEVNKTNEVTSFFFLLILLSACIFNQSQSRLVKI